MTFPGMLMMQPRLIRPKRAHLVTAGTAASLVAAAFTGLGATSSSKSSLVQTIYVRNTSTVVSDAEVRRDLPAFQEATSKDFAPIWHVDAKLVFLGSRTAPVGSETMTIVDKGSVQGALAFHELTNGVPDSIIYAGTAKFYGYSWSVGFTHELWEMLADPGLVEAAQSQDGTIWAEEIADPVEADADGFLVKGVLVSDFVTEKWFGAQVSGPFDYCNHIQAPLVIDKGGYAQWWSGTSWTLVSNFEKGGLGDGRGFYK